MYKAIVSVTNDLTTDQRVNRTCVTLASMGFDVLLVGRHLKSSLPLPERPYHTKRLRLLFHKGPLFYAEYNLRLFFFLLFRNCDLLFSNDLDTLLANHFVSVHRFIPLVHDCHEYFRGVPELVGRPRVTKIWKRIEDRIFPKLRHVVAVNDSIAHIYQMEYGTKMAVVRNVPFRRKPVVPADRKALGIADGDRVILYQGAVNVGRGLEEIIQALPYIKSSVRLLIIGTGDILEQLKGFAKEQGLQDRVIFTGQIPFEQLPAYTALGDIGISIERDLGVNYQNCLPNKFLDYIQARIPVLISPFPEMEAIVTRFRIGRILRQHEPAYIGKCVEEMLANPEELARYRRNLEMAAADLCWENEVQKLESVINQALLPQRPEDQANT